MRDLDSQLVEMLRRRAGEIRGPIAPRRRDLRRARLRQAGVILASLAFATGGVFAAALGVQTLTREPQPADGSPAEVLAPPAAPLAYVLDPRWTQGQGELSRRGRVLVVDPRANPPVVKEIVVGAGTVMAVSPDGSRLYLASVTGPDVPEPEYTLTVVDTASGEVLRAASVRHVYEPRIALSPPPMVVAADGRHVYLVQVSPWREGEEPTYSLATFDAEGGRFLPETVPLGACGAPGLFPGRATGELVVLCMHSRSLHVLRISNSGAAVDSAVLTLPTVPDLRPDSFGNLRDFGALSYGAMAEDGTTFYAVTRNGRVFVVDLGSMAVAQTVGLELPPDVVIPPGKVEISADGGTLLLGLQRIIDGELTQANRVLAVSIDTWTHLAEVLTSQPFWMIAADPHWPLLYALHPERRSLLVIDTSSFREIRALTLGVTPQVVAVPGG